MSRQKVVVTGGAGFIGSHLVEMYAENGYEVIIVDDLSTGYRSNIESLLHHEAVHFEQVSICDLDKLKTVFERYQPDIVNHHAAQKSVSDSVEDPMFDANINVIGLLNVLECCGLGSVKTVLYTSSGGALAADIIDDEYSREDQFPQLLSPYAITKFAGEYYVRVYAKKFQFNYSIQRYANVYGPRQVASGECGVIPIFVNNLMAEKPSILMTYPDMPRGCTRDYIYVKDVAEFNLMATKQPKNDVFNLGNSVELPILDIYHEIEAVFQMKQDITIQGPRAGDIKRSVLDCTKVKESYHWQPKYSLREGLQDLFESL